MRDEIPAAFPLIAYVGGLVAARGVINPISRIAGLCAIAIVLAFTPQC